MKQLTQHLGKIQNFLMLQNMVRMVTRMFKRLIQEMHSDISDSLIRCKTEKL
jgi:TRAP-type mannitol/chloroaromatic compound transport system permease small subunit